MFSRKIKYENILHTQLKELTIEREAIVKLKEGLEPENKNTIAIDINKRISLLDKKIGDANSELLMVKEHSIDIMKELLYTKEKECVYLTEILKSLYGCENVSSYKYIDGVLMSCEEAIQEHKNRVAMDIHLIREDINTLILIETLGIKVYEVDTVFITEKNVEKDKDREFRTVDGFFFTSLEDRCVLILIKEEGEDVSKFNIEYAKKLNYKGKDIYIDIKHNIPKEKLPF